jgi:hypothetical protein
MPSVRPPRRDDRERTAYRGESSAAGVVTKRIDRGDGAFELSFYAIGPKRSTYAEAVGDLQGFAEPADRAWIYCSDRLPETAGRYEVALFAPGGYPEHPYLARHFATWMHRGEWNTGLRPEQVVYAWRPIVEAPPPLRPADRDFLLAAGVPAEWLEPKGD